MATNEPSVPTASVVPSLMRQLRPAVVAVAVATVVCGLLYPLVITGAARVIAPASADGSLLEVDGRVVGSELIGQEFVGEQYFRSRPSAAGDGYDGAASSGSNLGPSNDELLSAVAERVDDYRRLNDLPPQVQVPVDAVTSSGSGLDPHISPANAALQAPRVAAARGLPLDTVTDAVERSTDRRPLGVLGDTGVNVLRLNLALDELRSDQTGPR